MLIASYRLSNWAIFTTQLGKNIFPVGKLKFPSQGNLQGYWEMFSFFVIFVKKNHFKISSLSKNCINPMKTIPLLSVYVAMLSPTITMSLLIYSFSYLIRNLLQSYRKFRIEMFELKYNYRFLIKLFVFLLFPNRERKSQKDVVVSRKFSNFAC